MTSRIFKTPIPYLALLLAHMIWGANFVVAKIALQEFPPMSLALLRFSLASLFLAPFFYAQTKKVKIDKADFPKLVAIGVLAVTLNITFFFEGIKRTTVIDASILALTTPMLSVLFGWWFLREKVYLVNLLGIALGFIGCLTIIGLPQILGGSFSSGAILGNVLIILASICWVTAAVIARRVLKKYPSLITTATIFMVGTITFFIPAAVEYLKNPSWTAGITILGIIGLTYMTILSSICAYFLFEWGLSKTSVAMADLFQYIEPIIATILAVLILGEKLSPTFVAGALFIAVGAFLATMAKEIHHRHKAHRT